MPIHFGAEFVEGKVYRSKKKQEGDGEKEALKELNTILAYKNRRSCDCEAQIHDLLENCLNCGRLTCTSEGPGRCFSCDNVVLNSEQRVKLSKFVDVLQLTSTQPSSKTGDNKLQIIDNQYDQLSIDNKRHLRAKDRAKFQEDLEELRSKQYQRKLQLQVDISNLEAGSHSMPAVDNYEKAMKNLQLSQHPEATLNFNLIELVSEESRKNYSLDYIPPNERKKNQVDPISKKQN